MFISQNIFEDAKRTVVILCGRKKIVYYVALLNFMLKFKTFAVFQVGRKTTFAVGLSI